MAHGDQHRLIEQIHGSGRQLVLAVTGGGSGAISALLQVPGASASVLKAVVPYSARAMQQWLGGPVEQYCSEQTARSMAMRAYERARQLTDADPHTLIGIGATASLATNRPKRGQHRIHVASQSASLTDVATCQFLPPGRRAAEENLATQLILWATAEACGITASPKWETTLGLHLSLHSRAAPDAWTELLLGQRRVVDIPDNRERGARPILFPGAFNPPHWGHERMAEIAAKRYGKPVTFELSVTNVDKPPLDYIEIENRLYQLWEHPVMLTRAPTFAEKASIAPGCVFIVGADTIHRIADPRYYGDDAAKRDAAIAEIAGHGCRFLVFGRSVHDRFTSASEVCIPPALRQLCDEVPESEFRADVSSTELRRASSD